MFGVNRSGAFDVVLEDFVVLIILYAPPPPQAGSQTSIPVDQNNRITLLQAAVS
jgi:hypothetical protein